MRRPATVAAVAAAVALAGLLGGCGGLPTPGGVKVVRTVGAAVDDSGDDVRVLVPGPAPDLDPAQVVTGFLNAEANSNEDDYAVAREYLGAGAAWNTGATAVVYQNPATVVRLGPRGTTATVTVSQSLVATIDARGTYVPQAGTRSETYALTRSAAGWRIGSLPVGLRLTPSGLHRTFTESTLWWFTPDQQRLVPDQRWLPQQVSGRTTQLVRALLGGPSPALAGAVRTAVPAGTTLEGSVAVEGSDVAVDLSREALSLGAAQARSLLLQLAATVRDVTSVTGVRLLVDGQPVPAAGDPRRIATSDATPYLPPTAGGPAPVLDVAGGRVQVLGPGAIPPQVARALAAHPVTQAVSSPDGTSVAAVTGGEVVVVGTDGTVRRVVAAADAALSWTQDGRLAVGLPTRMLVVQPFGAVTQIAYPAGLPAPVTDLRIARDGVRVVLTAGAPGSRHPYVATLSGTSLVSPVAIVPGGGDVAQVSWADATDVAFVTAPAGQPAELLTSSIDGSSVDQVPLPAAVGRAAYLASGPGSVVLVAGDGSIQELTGENGWRRVAAGDRVGVA